MQVLLVLWLLVMGMVDVQWDGAFDRDAAVPSDTPDVVAAEGPVYPPKP